MQQKIGAIRVVCPERTNKNFSFVAENWKSGWLGQFMWGVFTNYMDLESSDIIAMTSVNFTGATNPKNSSSVYNGSSSFTRCVWEINLGNVVSGLDSISHSLEFFAPR